MMNIIMSGDLRAIKDEIGMAFALLQAYMNFNKVNFDFKHADRNLVNTAKIEAVQVDYGAQHDSVNAVLRFDELADSSGRSAFLSKLTNGYFKRPARKEENNAKKEEKNEQSSDWFSGVFWIALFAVLYFIFKK